jgi:hypothetical protein
MAVKLPGSPTIGVIDDESGVLTLNWQPPLIDPITGLPSSSGTYASYLGWNIYITPLPNGTPQLQSVAGQLPTGTEAIFQGTPDSRIYETVVSAGEYAVDMQAVPSIASGFLTSNLWVSLPGYNFPTTLVSSQVTLDKTVADKNEPILITLDGAYIGASTWRAVFQDSSTSDWLPLNIRSIIKTFDTPGNQNIIIQVQNDLSLAQPPVQLRRQITKNVYVMDQEFNPNQTSTGPNLITTVGFGGSQGFEISTLVPVPAEPYAVIVRALAVDTLTNELKLLVASARTADASSLLGTLAVDVFPLRSRPHKKDLIDIPAVLATTASTSIVPVKIQTTVLPVITVGKPMPSFVLQVLDGSGTFPYTWYSQNLPLGLNLSLDGTLTGTPQELGTSTIDFVVQDSSNPPFVDKLSVPLIVQSDLTIITPSILPSATVGTSYLFPIVFSGGIPPFHWSVVNGALTKGLAIDETTGVISGLPSTYNSTTDFSVPASATIQVIDAIGAIVSKTFSIALNAQEFSLGQIDQQQVFVGEQFRLSCPIYGGKAGYNLLSFADDGIAQSVNKLDGRIEFLVNPTAANIGTRTIVFTIQDSAGTIKAFPRSYTVLPAVNPVVITLATFDHIWNDSDSTAVPLNINGSLNGLTLSPTSSIIAPNGITVTVDNIAKTVTATGPSQAGNDGNSEVQIPLNVFYGAAQVAKITREYTLISSASASLGSMSVKTRPYVVGDFVGIHVLKPYFNSPSFSISSAFGATSWQVKAGSALPRGLSFNSVNSLIYGVLQDTAVTNTFIEYLSGGVVIGTVNIIWDTKVNSFSLIDNISTGSLQVPYESFTNNFIQSPVPLANAFIYRGNGGRLPSGLSIALDVTKTKIVVSGSPTETGYFDLWFGATDTNGNKAYLYKRLAINYVDPLLIVTGLIPPAGSNISYSFQMQGFGGVIPYVWSIDAGVLPAGLTLSSSGLISGTTPVAANTFPVTIGLRDSRGAKVQTQFVFSVLNIVRLTTTTLPIGSISTPYSFALSAIGGVPPYTFALTSGVLPVGLTLHASGVIDGTVSNVPGNVGYDQNLTFRATDSASNVSVPVTLEMKIAVPSGVLNIDSSGLGVIPRGKQYLGTLAVTGTGVPNNVPYNWSIAPDTPNPLPSGLNISANPADNGATAFISGTTTAVVTGLSVKVHVLDNLGNSVSSLVALTSQTTLKITTTGLPVGTINGSYSATLTNTGGVGPFNWSLLSGSLPTGYSITALTGQILGTYAGGAQAFQFVVKVLDSLGDFVTASLSITEQASGLAITTSSLPAVTAGIAYSTALQGSGSPNVPYTWSLDSTSSPLPSGLSLNATSGVISGNIFSASSVQIVIRLTDNIGAFVTRAFLLTVTTQLALVAGPDYINGSSARYLGYIAGGDPNSISPRPNRSFYVIATGVLSTQTNQIQVNIGNAGITALVDSISQGVAFIRLAGNFAGGTAGDNSLSITVVDSGVSVSATFKWKVYSDILFRLVPNSGNLPSRIV